MKKKRIASLFTAVFMTISAVLPNFAVSAEVSPKSDEDVSVVSNSSDLQVKSTNSFGKLFSEPLQEEISRQYDSECVVNSVEMDGNTAKVSFRTVIDCMLTVAIYDNSGMKMLASGTEKVNADETEKEVTIDTDNMPEDFVVKAYLTSPDGLAPLSDVYENTDNTSEMKEFFALTVDDFDAEKVVNLDDDKTNNFVVYSDNVKIIKKDTGYNKVIKVDDENGIYIFENINEEISLLKEGDIFSYGYHDENDMLVVKVESISIDGTTAEIISAAADIEEVFEYIKIDNKSNLRDAEYTPIESPDLLYYNFDNIEYYDVSESSKSYENSAIQVQSLNSIPNNLGSTWLYGKSSSQPKLDIELKGGIEHGNDYVKGSAGAVFTLAFTKEDPSNDELNFEKLTFKDPFGKERELKDVNACMKTDFTGSLMLNPSIEVKIYEFKWIIPTKIEAGINLKLVGGFSVEHKRTFTFSFFEAKYYIIPGLLMTFAPEVTIELSGKGEVNFQFTSYSGVKYEKKDGKHSFGKDNNKNKLPQGEFKCTGEVTLSISLDLGPKFIFFKKEDRLCLDTDLKVKGELKISADIYSVSSDNTKKEDIHMCCIEEDGYGDTGCFKGSLDLILSVGGKCKILGKEVAKLTVAEVPIHVVDGYYSVKYNELKMTICPHKKYYYNITMINSEDESIENVKAVVNNKYEFVSDKNGKMTVYLDPGDNTIKFTNKDYKDKTLKLKVDVKNEINYKNNVNVSKKDEWNIDILKLSYSIDEKVKIDSKESRNKKVKMVSQYNKLKVTVKDEKGNIIPDASIEILPELEDLKVTESNGVTTFELEEGKYALTVSKEGYGTQINKISIKDKDIDKEVVLYKGHKLNVNVKDEEGNIIPDADVYIMLNSGDNINPTDSNGIKSFELSNGVYNLYASKDGYKIESEMIIIEDEDYSLNITLLKVYNLEVTVKDEKGSIVDAGIKLNPVQTNLIPSGAKVKTLKLINGEYTMTVSKKGYKTEEFKINIDGKDEVLEVNLVKKYLPSDNELTWNIDGNIEWAFHEETGLLKIRGEGEMPDYHLYSIDGTPWLDYKEKIKSVIIESGITTIGCWAFWDCANLSEITIPDSVKNIDAFAINCDKIRLIIADGSKEVTCNITRAIYNIEEVEIPESVISIEESAFEHQINLKKVTIYGENLKEIGSKAFHMCENLTEIILPNSIENIGGYAFCGCRNLKEIAIPNSITSINESTFSGCKNLELEKATIPNGVINIEQYAFKNCSNIKKVIMPDSVTDMGIEVFSGCSSLEEIILSNNLTSIDNETFYGCKNIEEIIIPDSVTGIYWKAFGDCIGLTEITIPNSVKLIYVPFEGCENLTEITIPDSVTDCSLGCSVKKVIIADGSKEINSGMLPGTFEEIIIPDSVTSIGEEAFRRSYGFTEITIPNSVTSIGKAAFWGCEGLTKVNIPDSVTSIEWYTFAECLNLKEITISDNVTNIDERAFEGCSIENVIIADDSKTINPIMIPSKYTIKSIVIPNSVTSIGNEAFYCCESLTEITIPDNVTSIGTRAFANCASLTSITIPNSVKNIGENAFSDCENLTEIIIPDNVTYIGNEAFCHCTSLTEITISNSVTNINDDTFKGCTSLTEIIIPNSVTNIGHHAFHNCINLTSITIPNSVTNIGDEVFAYCENLEKIIISDSVTSIGNMAFWACINIKDVYYSGTEEQWEKINIGELNECLTNATIHYGVKAEEVTKETALVPLTTVLYDEEQPFKKEEFSNLKPNTQYNFYVFKDKYAENPLSADNLLYISQGISDENGNLEIEYIPREETDSPESMLVSRIYNIESTTVEIESMSYNDGKFEAEIAVNHNGKTLEKGVDYEVSGIPQTLTFESFAIIITGIGDYYGEKVIYSAMICRHNFVDDICTVCGMKKSEVTELYGDVDNDGEVTLKDVVIIKRYLVGGWNIELDEIIADVDNDGKVTINDVLMIRKYLIGDGDI